VIRAATSRPSSNTALFQVVVVRGAEGTEATDRAARLTRATRAWTAFVNATRDKDSRSSEPSTSEANDRPGLRRQT